MVIRPLAYCRERDLARYARARDFPIIPCDLCGSQEQLKRKQVKAMIADWERTDSKRVDSIIAALKNVVPSHLMDPGVHDFSGVDPAAD